MVGGPRQAVSSEAGGSRGSASASPAAAAGAAAVGVTRQHVTSGLGGLASAPPAPPAPQAAGAAAEAGIEDEDVALEVLLRKAAVMGVAEADKPSRLRAVTEWLDR